MKLLLVAIAVIAAVHYGQGTTINTDTTVCELAQMFGDAMDEAVNMGCPTDETITDAVSRAGCLFQRVSTGWGISSRTWVGLTRIWFSIRTRGGILFFF